MKSLLWILVAAILALTACNYTEGECYYRDDVGDNGGVGVGGSITPGGAGGYGDVPREPQDATDEQPPECNAIGSYDASLFKFKTTLADDGSDVGGGYQEASATVKFVDGRQDPPASWSCAVTFKMPLRTKVYGKISPGDAAEYAADVLTLATGITMKSRPVWIKALFCSKLQDAMIEIFKNQYAGLGGTATSK